MKLGVFCVVSRLRIVGPIFFENTINLETYTDTDHGSFGHLAKSKPPNLGSDTTGLRVSRSNHFERTVAPKLTGLVNMGVH